MDRESLLKLFYEKGMENPWLNGKAAFYDGNYIVEEDRLNKHSIIFVESKEELKKALLTTNQCLGTGYIYKNFCFINQINGGDEWLTMIEINGKAYPFESISFQLVDKSEDIDKYLDRLFKAHLEDRRIVY